MPSRGGRHRPEALGPGGRISLGTKFGLAKRRMVRRVRPVDLDYLRRSGTVARGLRPFLDAADLEGVDLTLAYEGSAEAEGYRPMSEPRRAILGDFLRVGVVMRCELARYLQSQDADAGFRVVTATANRRAALKELGLEHREREVDLTVYLESQKREIGPGDASAADSDHPEPDTPE